MQLTRRNFLKTGACVAVLPTAVVAKQPNSHAQKQEYYMYSFWYKGKGTVKLSNGAQLAILESPDYWSKFWFADRRTASTWQHLSNKVLEIGPLVVSSDAELSICNVQCKLHKGNLPLVVGLTKATSNTVKVYVLTKL